MSKRHLRLALKFGIAPDALKRTLKDHRKAVVKKAKELLVSPGTILAAGHKHLTMTAAHLARHVLIAGGSGNGKSKLQELMICQLIKNGEGLTFIDRHGDTAKAVLTWCVINNIDPRRILYLKPGIDCSMSLDPYAEIPDGLNPLQYEAFLTSVVDRIIKAILRNVAAADQELMKRLKNWLGVILYAAGVKVDGRYLGLADVLILTDPGRPAFAEVYERVLPHMNPDLAAELAKLRHEKNSNTRDKWLESTINALRELLKGPLVRLIFAQEAESYSPKTAIKNQLVMLVDLSASDYLSTEQGSIIGGMMINFTISTAQRIEDEGERVQHYLIIDEAETFIGEDLRMGCAELRKFRLVLILSIQDLSCLRRGELDLVGKFVSQCGVIITFQQGNPEDIEFLAQLFGYETLDLTPLMTDTVMPDGYEWVATESYSMGTSESHTESQSTSQTQTHSTTRQRHTSESIQEGFSLALSKTESEGTSSTKSAGQSISVSNGQNLGGSLTQSEGVNEGEAVAKSHSESSSQSDGKTKGDSTTKSATTNNSLSDTIGPDGQKVSHNQGNTAALAQGDGHSSGISQTNSAGVNDGITVTRSAGTNESVATGTNWGNSTAETNGANNSISNGQNNSTSQGLTIGNNIAFGNAKGESSGESDGKSSGNMTGTADGTGQNYSITQSKTPLAKYKFGIKPSGSLVVSINDQLGAWWKKISTLAERVTLVKVRGMGFPFPMQVHDVLDPYVANGTPRCLAWRDDDMKRYLAKIRAAHKCFFVPTVDDQAARVRRFLGTRATEVAGVDVPDVVIENENDDNAYDN